MKRLVLNLAAFATIVSGGTYLASSAQADAVEAECGSCSGVCCGFNSDGTCWASDKCDATVE